MKFTRSLPHLLFLAALGLCLAGAPQAQAQAPAIIENGFRNVFIIPPAPTINPDGVAAPVTGDPLLPAYQAQGQNGTAFGGFPINGYGTLQTNTTVTQPPVTYNPLTVPYPKSDTNAQVLVSVELRSAIIGRPISVFNISYNFGGEIPPPTKFDASNQPIAGYYRFEPLNARLKTTVVVNSSTGVEVSRNVVNAIATDVDGTTKTVNVPTSGQTTIVTIGLNPQFYWSKHARKVFATQPGAITVQWREAATTAVRTETYQIASSPDKTERTIFWTENGFRGPLVEVPAGRANAVNFIYNSLVPKEVVTPYEPWLSGQVDFTVTAEAEKRYKTVYYDNNIIHAYNVEGRLFLEYLGNPRTDGTNEQKGYEIVNVIKEATPGTRVVDLGEQIKPDASSDPVPLQPSILAGLGLTGSPYIHQQVSADGTSTLYAIRETLPGVANASKVLDNSVLVYWLETSILNIKWPKQFLGYVQQWPDEPSRYSVYARPDATGTAGQAAAEATAVQLDSTNNPALVYQDDPTNLQAVLLPGNKFYTKVTPTAATNRALLRFSKDEDVWFERVWSQLDPYSKDPTPLVTKTVTTAADGEGDFATGFTNISNVRVVNAANNSPLDEGVDKDYTVDLATGKVRLIEKQYIESVASLGTLNAGNTVAVRLFAGWDGSQVRPSPNWEARSLSLTSAGAAGPLASVDFRTGNGGFTVSNTGTLSVGPWAYDAPSGTWRVGGSAQVASSTLTSPSFTVTQTGAATLTLRHRYFFETTWDGGQIQFSVNGGAWTTVQDAAFTVNGYTTTMSNGVFNPARAFSNQSAGYGFVQTITSLKITFEAPTLPFSSVPAVVDADIGTRIEPGAIAATPYGDTAPVYVGYIHQPSGTAYDYLAYKDPFVAGFDEAAKGAIIGVNALAGNDQLEVWWYRKSTPAGTKITGTYWPSFVQKYRLKWPSAAKQIELASNAGSDDLPSLQATGQIYVQNNSTEVGYNPNEEHALMLNGRAWALRDDLNLPTSSERYVLLHYTEADQRPAMRVFEVTRGSFDYPAIAGKVLQSPMPLPLLPPPLLPDRTLASYEKPGVQDPFPLNAIFGTADAAFAHYQKFTWTDRKGILWVYRGPHGDNVADPMAPTAPTLIMRYFYKTLPGFYYPSLASGSQPAVGTITPYLRSGTPGAYLGDPVTGAVTGTPATQRAEQPMNVTFRPQWPDSAPELRVGETLTLPKVGLPQVRGQASAELIYQQSVALENTIGKAMADRKKSARLFDPTRAKIYHLGGPASIPTSERSNLPAIPASVNTSVYLGKTYFPNLPPHLSSRLYFDPAVGQYGSLIFKGLYMNELFGEKYLQLNVMSAADLAAAKGLVPEGDDKAKWVKAIEGLATTVETFIENPARLGTFIPLTNETATPRLPIFIDGIPQGISPGTLPLIATAPAGSAPGATQRAPVLPADLAEVFYSDTAVDSYAISASGGGSGYVVLAVGNGRDTDFTPDGQPVSLEVFKVAAPLYRGELKVVQSQNPLDEKLTLQHTGDFAGHPEEYDFEWRYAPPADGLPLKVYSFVRTSILADSTTAWTLIHNPLGNSGDPNQDFKKYRVPSAGISDTVISLVLGPTGSYSVLPTDVTISQGRISSATAVIDGELNDVAVKNPGTGYTQAPTVTFTGGGGSGASAYAEVGPGGTITRIVVDQRGSGYTSAPTVTLTPVNGGGGSGAVPEASVRIKSLKLTNGGIGYTAPPAVTFGGGTLAAGGTGASATATIGAPPVVDPASITIDNDNGTAAHGVTLPNALLRRTFSATTRPLRLFLSLDLGDNDGAVVYLNGAQVAAYRAPGYEDSATTSVPATAPAFTPLPLVFEINANALVANATPNNNVFTVELYTSADAGSTTTFNLRLEGSQEVENLTGWLSLIDSGDTTRPGDTVVTTYQGISAVNGKNRHTIQGTSILTLSDNYVIMRYRAKDSTNAAYKVPTDASGWSKWTEPQLAEGWIKRVLAGINPFQQRVKDLFNHEINTSVSLVEQAGKRWEGNIALNLENINDSGLIEIYETVLNRGKDLSINGTPAINYGGANDALLLAAGYLSDLYMIMGNEAYADAANPTIAFSTTSAANFITQYGDVSTALFAFKGQLATVLDEELTLLRGRDDSLLPGARKTPVYNRLVWNYTRGISSGEAIYALNYNIKDRVWDYSLNTNNAANLPTDGIISAADAAISYPQGHGDAYGHYLTALTGYYGLLNNPNFSWTPRIEAVLVLGQPVSVDYQDERKFAAAAVAVARTASHIVDLTYRQQYTAAENAGWSNLTDGKSNPNTGTTRYWGTDDWASRGGQGALFHWATANSLLPSVDPNPNHSGIQKIDRTTVPELAELAAQAASIQQSLDGADAHLNPLGLAPGALTFDISPTDVDAGKTHYEQIYARATGALQNAVSAFNNAKGSTQFLRQQEDTLDDQRNAIYAQEQAYTNQLIELYGTPYTDDIGPGKTYKQDYAGPDLLHYMYVELPEIINNPAAGVQTPYTINTIPVLSPDNPPQLLSNATTTYTINAEGDVVKPETWSGRRSSPGTMQTKVSNMLLARQQVFGALKDYFILQQDIESNIGLLESAFQAKEDLRNAGVATAAAQAVRTAVNLGLAYAEKKPCWRLRLQGTPAPNSLKASQGATEPQMT